MKNKLSALLIIAFALSNGSAAFSQTSDSKQIAGGATMRFADSSRGRAVTKDPHVIRFNNRYLMYYSLPPFNDGRANDGWAVGIAESRDLENWRKVGEVLPAADYDKNGLAAPGAIVLRGKVHLFYQTYGNGSRDAICHAVSTDGVNFERDQSNPIFRPTGDWTNGRAIDAEVVQNGKRLFLYFATRDPAGKIQKLGAASAPLDSDFARAAWTQTANRSILEPELAWEKNCIEAASVIKRGNKFVMFYAGAYNNEPQQIGAATSADGVNWQRLSDEPFLPNGAPNSWNHSESGHPHIFKDADGKTYLFFQGNNDNGKTWYISKVEIGWRKNLPYLKTK